MRTGQQSPNIASPFSVMARLCHLGRHYEVLVYGKVSVARAGELLRDVGAQETGGARNRHPHGKSGFS